MQAFSYLILQRIHLFSEIQARARKVCKYNLNTISHPTPRRIRSTLLFGKKIKTDSNMSTPYTELGWHQRNTTTPRCC